jgi:hypothetical protein
VVAGCHKCMTPFGSWTLRGPTPGRLLPPQARRTPPRLRPPPRHRELRHTCIDEHRARPLLFIDQLLRLTLARLPEHVGHDHRDGPVFRERQGDAALPAGHHRHTRVTSSLLRETRLTPSAPTPPTATGLVRYPNGRGDRPASRAGAARGRLAGDPSPRRSYPRASRAAHLHGRILRDNLTEVQGNPEGFATTDSPIRSR